MVLRFFLNKIVCVLSIINYDSNYYNQKRYNYKMTNLWQWAKEKTRSTMYAISGRSETEKLVLEATNDDKWGPSNSQMEEISRLTFNYEDCENIKKVIWERLEQIDEVRTVQKTLLLLEYLLRNGHESFRSEANSMSRILQSLTSLNRYQVGENAALEAVIRKKAKDILTLASDNEAYRMEREKASKIKQKVYNGGTSGNSGYGGYGGYGGFGGSSGGYGSNRYGSVSGGYDSYDNDFQLPSRQKQTQNPPAGTNTNDNEYEYEYDDDGPPSMKKQNQNNQGFNPYPTNQSQNQNNPGLNPYPTNQNQNNQGFNPYPTNQTQNNQGFNPYPTNQTQNQNNQGFNPYPTNQTQTQNNQGFNPYPTNQPQNTQASNVQSETRQPRTTQTSGAGAGFLPPPPGMRINRPPQQQPVQQQQTADILNFSQPAPTQANNNNNLLDFGATSSNAQQTPQPAPPKQPDPLLDLFDFNGPPAASPAPQQPQQQQPPQQPQQQKPQNDLSFLF